MLDGNGQDQRELKQMLSINEGYLVLFSSQTGTPLRGFAEVRTVTTATNIKKPHRVPTGELELNIFTVHFIKSLPQIYWEEKNCALVAAGTFRPP